MPEKSSAPDVFGGWKDMHDIHMNLLQFPPSTKKNGESIFLIL